MPRPSEVISKAGIWSKVDCLYCILQTGLLGILGCNVESTDAAIYARGIFAATREMQLAVVVKKIKCFELSSGKYSIDGGKGSGVEGANAQDHLKQGIGAKIITVN